MNKYFFFETLIKNTSISDKDKIIKLKARIVYK